MFCIVLTGLGAGTESNDKPVSPSDYDGGGDIEPPFEIHALEDIRLRHNSAVSPALCRRFPSLSPQLQNKGELFITEQRFRLQ